MALVRVQAVILQSTYLMHCFPISKGVYEAAICPYLRAAPLRRNLRTISFIAQLTIPHFTYQFAPSTSGRPSLWSTALCSNSLPDSRRIKQPLTPLTSSETSHHFLIYPCRCRHRRHGRSCSPTQPSPNVRHGSMSAQLCLARWDVNTNMVFWSAMDEGCAASGSSSSLSPLAR